MNSQGGRGFETLGAQDASLVRFTRATYDNITPAIIMSRGVGATLSVASTQLAAHQDLSSHRPGRLTSYYLKQLAVKAVMDVRATESVFQRQLFAPASSMAAAAWRQQFSGTT